MSTPTVIATGTGVEAGTAYARTTGTRLHAVPRPADIPSVLQGLTGEVIFALDEGTSVSELAYVVGAACDAGVKHGFLDFSRGVEHGRRHAAALAGWAASAPPGITFWNALGDAPAVSGTFGDVEIVARAAPDAVERLMVARRTLAVISHGNGIEVPMGAGFLCGRRSVPAEERIPRFLPCGQGGRCIRGRAADGVLTDPVFYSPADLGGDVVIWGTCYGYLAADSVFNPRGGIVAGWLDRAGRAAPPQIITTYRAIAVDPASVLAACILAESGRPLGEVVFELNAMFIRSNADVGTPPWLLIGDPCSSVPPADHGHVPGAAILTLAPGDPAGAEPVLVERSGPAAPSAVWVRRLPGADAAVIVAGDAPGTTPGSRRIADCLRQVKAEKAATETLRRIWGSTRCLALTHAFFQLAEASLRPGSFDYDTQTRSLVESWLGRLTVAASLEHPLAELSGDQEAVLRRIESESTGWSQLCTLLLTLLTEVAQASSGVISSAYGTSMPARVDRTEIPCPYCASSSSAMTYRFVAGLPPRTIVQCLRCTNISDADETISPIVLEGPDDVVAGRETDYTLRIGGGFGEGVQCLAARVVAHEPPWGHAAGADRARISTDLRGKPEITLTWYVPADIEPGRHFIFAPVVIDGTVALARRPITVHH